MSRLLKKRARQRRTKHRLATRCYRRATPRRSRPTVAPRRWSWAAVFSGGAGTSAATNDITTTVWVAIDGSTVDAAGAVDVTATSTARSNVIRTGGGGGKFPQNPGIHAALHYLARDLARNWLVFWTISRAPRTQKLALF